LLGYDLPGDDALIETLKPETLARVSGAFRLPLLPFVPPRCYFNPFNDDRGVVSLWRVTLLSMRETQLEQIAADVVERAVHTALGLAFWVPQALYSVWRKK
jgi:hypothetical protein